MFTLGNFYKSDEWESFRRIIMDERLDDNGDIVCEYCHKPIVRAYDCIGHHVKELTESNVNDWNISLNRDNIILVHHKCHNKIHERFGHEWRRKVYIVYGSPCAGKSTWVRDNAGTNDLILDIDSIWECISTSRSKRLRENMFGVRDCIMEQIKMRVGKWQTAFVVGGYPNKYDRERLADMLGAELIFIDESIETCMSRATTDDEQRFIRDWFSDFIP
ncbi:MAG: HNH endonuclease [Bacteroidales bacterium]|nr:HNH endonuclease [Bacteroidales bacterium]